MDAVRTSAALQSSTSTYYDPRTRRFMPTLDHCVWLWLRPVNRCPWNAHRRRKWNGPRRSEVVRSVKRKCNRRAISFLFFFFFFFSLFFFFFFFLLLLYSFVNVLNALISGVLLYPQRAVSFSERRFLRSCVLAFLCSCAVWRLLLWLLLLSTADYF